MDNINLGDLFTTKMCSPLIAFAVIVVIFGISLFNTRSILKSYNTTKMDNLFNVFSWHEVKLVIVIGIILYGMCQYNQVYLAWIFMFLPVIYLTIKNLMIFLFVSLAHQNAPKAQTEYLQQNYGMSSAMQQAMMQSVQQQPVDKTINMVPSMQQPMSSSLQQLAGQSNQNLQQGMQAPLGQQMNSNEFAPVGFS